MSSVQVPVVIGATVAVIVVLVALIVGILLAWKHSISRRKKREAAEKTAREVKDDVFAAHPPRPILRPYIPPSDSGVTWVPQVRAVDGKELPILTITEVKERDITEHFIEPERTKASPPPAYSKANLTSPNVPQQAVPPQQSLQPTPQSFPQPLVSRFSMPSPFATAPPEAIEVVVPPQARKSATSSLPPTPATPCLTVEFSIESSVAPANPSLLPTPSPRTSSFRDIHMNPLAKGKTNRLMVVIQTFSPEREDELAIETGETLHLLQEFKDGWCLVQRINGNDAPQGVIPRFCVQDTKDMKDAPKAAFLQVPTN